MIKINTFVMALLILLQSCVTKKEILYLQNIDTNLESKLVHNTITLQPNDILNI